MPTQTPNLDLTLPLQTEYYNIAVHNANYTTIDTAVGNINTNKSDNLTQGNGIILTKDAVAKEVNVAVDPNFPASKLANKLTINGKDFNGSTVVNIIVGDELGSIKPWLAKTAPAGWLALDTGALVSRATYADLWTWVQANAPLITDSAWTVLAGTQNSVGSFSQGDGSTTFRLPKILDYVRGGLAADVGNWQADQFQGHWHQVVAHASTGSSLDPGHIPAGTSTINTYTQTVKDPINDGLNGTARYGDETRPKTIKMIYCIKAVNYILK